MRLIYILFPLPLLCGCTPTPSTTLTYAEQSQALAAELPLIKERMIDLALTSFEMRESEDSLHRALAILEANPEVINSSEDFKTRLSLLINEPQPRTAGHCLNILRANLAVDRY